MENGFKPSKLIEDLFLPVINSIVQLLRICSIALGIAIWHTAIQLRKIGDLIVLRLVRRQQLNIRLFRDEDCRRMDHHTLN